MPRRAAAGDELLTWVAATLREQVHAHDIVGRLGGDEFVALLGDPSSAARVRSALAARTGASIGVAVLDVDGADFDSLYAVADARLHQQKKHATGRQPHTDQDGTGLLTSW
ncbi:diguanylate cyclase domain-containing protein [Actinoplanes utahensis]|uniref:GGDEF domain-containing protein n=1 Tax=Actinoplanes utahensis TaxID=1869 RepID=A0A0A6UBJ7_ACTUT|nr:diguanylate cyclase [Actinoplanes utahensis]KHD73410.1 hypothetical protein MB27_34915 [Actinoplanes utahensis]GIF30177.1 hypothetical protein Aut01nite_31630 [Actinoplanes utahensis]